MATASGWRPHAASPSVSTRTSPSGCWRRTTHRYFRTISDFRKDNLDALSGLFIQVLALCQQAGLVKLGHVALDGTKVKANASKHKAMSYQRMKEREAQLAAEVAELLERAREVDDEEDRRYGKDKRGDELAGGVGLSRGSVGEDTGSHGGAGSRGAGGCRTGRG